MFGESHFIETPSENLVSNQNPYTPENVDEAKALCAVFDICPGHTWEQKIQKATPTSDGRIYQACSLCGMEETITPLLKVSNIKLAGTSYTYTGKVIKFTKKLNDKKTYTLVSAKKGSKSFKRYFKINKTTGKVTIKKNSKMKNGTYKVKVKVKALGNSNNKASAVKSVTFKVKVK